MTLTTPARRLRRAAAIASLGLAACGPEFTGPPEGALQRFAEGLSSPVHLTAPPDDAARVFIVERPGRIRVVRDGALLPSPFLDIAASVGSGGERGLLSLAFHPDYQANGFFFVNYTDTSGATRIVRFRVTSDPDVADPASASTVLTVAQPYPNHNGGQIAFGPDGMLYIAMGDGGSGGDPLDHGQRPSTLLGSLLRIDVDGAAPYSIPSDNPFVGQPGAAPETWAFGLRNPWRFSFDRATGDLYIGDVGQGGWEEVSYRPASSPGGWNFGWRIMEGMHCYEPRTGCDPTGITQPVYEYDHGDGCSITGGFVYRGNAAPTLRGRYFFADFCERWIKSFRIVDGEATDVLDHSADLSASEVSSFGEDALGELYVVSLGGSVYRVTAPQQN